MIWRPSAIICWWRWRQFVRVSCPKCRSVSVSVSCLCECVCPFIWSFEYNFFLFASMLYAYFFSLFSISVLANSDLCATRRCKIGLCSGRELRLPFVCLAEKCPLGISKAGIITLVHRLSFNIVRSKWRVAKNTVTVITMQQPSKHMDASDTHRPCDSSRN